MQCIKMFKQNCVMSNGCEVDGYSVCMLLNVMQGSKLLIVVM